jgi:hypothetical protein
MESMPVMHPGLERGTVPLRAPAILVLAVLTAGGNPRFAAAGTGAWLTGDSFRERLEQPVGAIFWSGLPLRPALVRLARTEQVAILLDRRVDPDQKVDLSLEGVSLREALGRIAKHLGLGLSLPESFAYFGPPRAAARLWTLLELRRDEARRLPAAASRRLLLADRLSWPDFASPRPLLARLAASGPVVVSPLEDVPHDLWAAADLPPLPLVDRIALVAAQFDLTFRFVHGGTGLQLVPIPDEVAVVRSYPGKHRANALAAEWADAVPGVRVKAVGERVFVKGRMEDQQRIADLASPPRRNPLRPAEKPAPAGAGEQRYTLRVVQKPLGDTLEQLAARFHLKLTLDEEALRTAGISLQQPVSFTATDVTLDGLFQALLRPAGCAFRLREHSIEVRPAR